MHTLPFTPGGPCRVFGCVAIGAAAPSRPSGVMLDGICSTHQQLPEADLRDLLKRQWEGTPRLARLNVGIEYERADGSQYGYDHNGRYYDVTPHAVGAR